MSNELILATSTKSMSTAVSTLMTTAGTVLETVTGNETLMVFFCAGIVGIAIGVVRKLKHA